MSAELSRIGLLTVYAVISVTGMVLLKSAETIVSLRGLVGFTFYTAGFLIWAGVILRVLPLSQAFPLAAGMLMLGTQLAGWLLLKERFGALHIGGSTLIFGGIVMVSLASQTKG